MRLLGAAYGREKKDRPAGDDGAAAGGAAAAGWPGPPQSFTVYSTVPGLVRSE